MTETQDSIGRWNLDTFGPADGDGPQHALRILDEVVELCLAAGATENAIMKVVMDVIRKTPLAERGTATPRPRPEKVPEEAADVQITLWGFAHRRGIDLQAETDEKMTTNRYARRWKLNGDGTAQHE